MRSPAGAARARALPVALAVTALLAGCTSLSRLPFLGATPRSPASGEWVDERKSTSTDTTVWVLAPDGDDALLIVHSDAGGTRREQRQHYGRWSDGRVVDSAGASVSAICFVRRPGRDAPSCNRFTIDSADVGGSVVRRLTVHGYAGAHHTGDRVLVERQRRAPDASAAPVSPSSPKAPVATAAGGSGEYDPRAVQPERPSVATHAGTVAAGFVEMEAGIEHDRVADGTDASQVSTVLKIGLAKRVQLSITVPTSAATGIPFGAGDVAIGLKWRLAEDRPLLQDVAVLPSVKFASGGVRGTGTTDVSLLLINSRTFGPVAVDLNLAATWRSGDGSQAPRTSTMWTVAAGIPVTGAFGWALETYGYPGTSGSAGSPPIVALLTGPTYVVRPELALDLGLIIPIVGPQPRALYLGLVASLGRLGKLAPP